MGRKETLSVIYASGVLLSMKKGQNCTEPVYLISRRYTPVKLCQQLNLGFTLFQEEIGQNIDFHTAKAQILFALKAFRNLEELVYIHAYTLPCPFVVESEQFVLLAQLELKDVAAQSRKKIPPGLAFPFSASSEYCLGVGSQFHWPRTTLLNGWHGHAMFFIEPNFLATYSNFNTTLPRLLSILGDLRCPFVHRISQAWSGHCLLKWALRHGHSSWIQKLHSCSADVRFESKRSVPWVKTVTLKLVFTVMNLESRRWTLTEWLRCSSHRRRAFPSETPAEGEFRFPWKGRGWWRRRDDTTIRLTKNTACQTNPSDIIIECFRTCEWKSGQHGLKVFLALSWDSGM